jgi:hypothetical protein
MMTDGNLTTKIVNLNEDDFQSDHSYNEIKQKMCKEASLNDYIRILASNFELPGCIFVNNVADQDIVNNECHPSLA